MCIYDKVCRSVSQLRWHHKNKHPDWCQKTCLNTMWNGLQVTCRAYDPFKASSMTWKLSLKCSFGSYNYFFLSQKSISTIWYDEVIVLGIRLMKVNNLVVYCLFVEIRPLWNFIIRHNIRYSIMLCKDCTSFYFEAKNI